MKITDILQESKAAEKAKQAILKRQVKLFNKLIDKAGELEEKGKVADAEELNNQATEVNDKFIKQTGMSIPDYETQQTEAGRDVGDMISRIKTTNLKPGKSPALISKEAGATALLLHILRDVAGQFDDDVANLLSGFLSSSKANPPTADQVAVARAVADRVKELGIAKDYASKTVGKLEKHSRAYDYDKENPSEYQDEY